MTVRFTAEISGGPDNAEELYCTTSTWQFGDGRMGGGAIRECVVWTPNKKFKRLHGRTYTYEKPGSYEATFTYGPLAPATVKVEVR